MSKGRNRVIPCLEPLEERYCPATTTTVFNSQPLPPYFIISFPTAPRTGGVGVQTGSALNISVAPMASTGPLAMFSNMVLLEDGVGDVGVSWDGLPFQFFSGVTQVNVLGTAPVNSVFFAALGPPQQAQQVNFALQGSVNDVFAYLPFPSNGLLDISAQPQVTIFPF